MATIAEDPFFRINEKAQSIADNIVGRGNVTPFGKTATLENASTMIDYLKEYKERFWFTPEITIYYPDNKINEVLSNCTDLIKRVKEKDVTLIELDDLYQQYPIGSIHEGIIVSIQNYGLIIQIGLNATGLVHLSNFGEKFKIEEFEVGDYVDVEILKLDEDKMKFSLRIINDTKEL